MGPHAFIAFGGRTLVVELATAAAFTAAGRRLLGPDGPDTAWEVLDRSPVSVRLGTVEGGGGGRLTGVGRRCRFEVTETGVVAEMTGGGWSGVAGATVVFTTEVQSGDVPLEDGTR